MTKATQSQRRAIALDFAMQNPILDPGEFAFEEDTRIFKVGDGVKHWADLPTAYIPANLMTRRGDMIVMGPSLVQGLTDPNLSVDTNGDGVADGWSVLGNPAFCSMVSNSQQVRSPVNGITSVIQTVPVIGGHTYRVSGKYIFNFLGSGTYQLNFVVTYYSDTALTNVLDVQSTEVDDGTPSEPTDWYILGTAPADAIRATISMGAYGGANVRFTEVSFVDNTTVGITRLGVGNPGQVLSQDEDGFLMWADDDNGDGESFITAAFMATTFKTIADAGSDHAGMLTTIAAADYETKNNAAIAHALHQYASSAATDYHTPASVTGLFENLDLTVVKGADQTVTNSTTQVNDSVLSFPMVANGVYIFEIFLLVSGTAANGLKFFIVSPTCLTNIFGVHAEPIAGGVTTGNLDMAVSTGNSSTPGGQQVGIDGSVVTFATVRGTIFNGTSAGTAQLTFAQVTAASATSCTIKKDSYLRAMRAS